MTTYESAVDGCKNQMLLRSDRSTLMPTWKKADGPTERKKRKNPKHVSNLGCGYCAGCL